MNTQQLMDLDHQYLVQTYGRNPIALDHGLGATLYDLEGKEYIDFASGIGVLSLGTIKNIVSSLGLDDAWWTNITVAAMICLFLVIQSVVLMRKNKAKQ